MIETAREIAQAGLFRLEALLAAPSNAGVGTVFAPSLHVISHGHVYLLMHPDLVLAMLAEIRSTATKLRADRMDREIIHAQFEDCGTLHALHVATWYAAGKRVAGPFSTMLRYRRHRSGWRVFRMQVSKDAPCSLARSLEPCEALYAETSVGECVERAIEALSSAILTGDSAQFEHYTRAPFLLQSDGNCEILRERHEFDSHLARVHADLRKRAVTEIVRSPKAIYTLDSDKLVANCVTFLLSGLRLATSSYSNSLIFEKSPDMGWRATALINPRPLMPGT